MFSYLTLPAAHAHPQDELEKLNVVCIRARSELDVKEWRQKRIWETRGLCCVG
jgi:hypothetical protein